MCRKDPEPFEEVFEVTPSIGRRSRIAPQSRRAFHSVSGIAIRLSRIATKELILDPFQATTGYPHRRQTEKARVGFRKAGHRWEPHLFGK
jgi:hypothetical protein